MKNERQKLLLLAAVSLSALGLAGCGARRPGPTVPHAGTVSRRVEIFVSQTSASLTRSFRQIYPERLEIGVYRSVGIAETESMLPAIDLRESQEE